jgi:hypothetical protein
MEYPAYNCDICGKEKHATNHWFAVRALNEMSFEVMTWAEAIETSNLSICEHVCGQECLHKRLSQWLDINSKTSPASSEVA